MFLLTKKILSQGFHLPSKTSMPHQSLTPNKELSLTIGRMLKDQPKKTSKKFLLLPQLRDCSSLQKICRLNCQLNQK